MKKKSLLLICLFLFANYLYSQERTILLMEGDTGYKSQSWFYCGHGNELDLNQIAAAWNEGKRIISAAYTEKGWFVTMAKNTGYTMQTYHYATDWPTNWIKEKQSKGYDITSVSTGKGKWFIVMSRGTSYTDQTWNWETWTAMSKFIKSQWDNNYYITQTTYFKGKWLVIMSKNSPYSAQGYFWCNTSDELKEKMEEKWQSNYNILLINYGDGEYFVIYGKYKKNNARAQYYKIGSNNISEYIKEKWADNLHIAYIGGGNTKQVEKPVPSSQYYSSPVNINNYNNNTYNNNQEKKVCYNCKGTGREKYIIVLSQLVERHETCPECGEAMREYSYHKHRTCSVCNGTGYY